MSNLIRWARVVADECGLEDWDVVEHGQTSVAVDRKLIRVNPESHWRSPQGGRIKVAHAIARAKGGGRSLGCAMVRETFFQIIDKHFEAKPLSWETNQ